MNQDCGQGAERKERILGTFWKENGQDYFLLIILDLLAFLPRLCAPLGRELLPPFSA